MTVFAGCLFGARNAAGVPSVLPLYFYNQEYGTVIPPGVSCNVPPPSLDTLATCTSVDFNSPNCQFVCGVLSQDGAAFGPYFPNVASNTATPGAKFLPVAYYDQNAFLSDDQADLLVQARDLKKYSFRVGWALFAIFGVAGIGCFAYGTWRKRHPQEVKLWSGQPMPSGSFTPRTNYV